MFLSQLLADLHIIGSCQTSAGEDGGQELVTSDRENQFRVDSQRDVVDETLVGDLRRGKGRNKKNA